MKLAEEYVNRWAVELNGDFDKLAPLFRAAMAEARAQALREAIGVTSGCIKDSENVIVLRADEGELVAENAWRHTRDGQIIVRVALRKLAGGAM